MDFQDVLSRQASREVFDTLTTQTLPLVPAWVQQAQDDDRAQFGVPAPPSDLLARCGRLYYWLNRSRDEFEVEWDQWKRDEGLWGPHPVARACTHLLESGYLFLLMPTDPGVDQGAFSDRLVASAEAAVKEFEAAGCPHLAQFGRDQLARTLIGRGEHEQSLKSTASRAVLPPGDSFEEGVCQALLNRSCQELTEWSNGVDLSVRGYLANLMGLFAEAGEHLAAMPETAHRGRDLWAFASSLNLAAHVAWQSGDVDLADKTSRLLFATCVVTGNNLVGHQAMAGIAQAWGLGQGLESGLALFEDLIPGLEEHAAHFYHLGHQRWPYIQLLVGAGLWDRAEEQTQKLLDGLLSPSLAGPRIDTLKMLYSLQKASGKTEAAFATLEILQEHQERRYRIEVKDKFSIIRRVYQEELLRVRTQELERFDALKDAFLSNTSHELRTPLHGMVGLAESLLDGAAGPLPDRAVRGLDLIVKSGQRLGSLVNDLLDYSLLKKGELKMDRRSVALEPLFKGVAELLTPLADVRGLALRVTMSPDLPPVWADPHRLEQILQNLVGNAIKFTVRGWVEISGRPTASGATEISVRDTGVGISPDRRDDVFLPFERLETSDAAPTQGSGLGLAITQQLVELHGGPLTLESESGRGSVFTFVLPQAPSPATLARPRVRQAGASTAPLVLVVDDDPANREVLENQLTLEGCRVVQATSGAEALELCEARLPDLVLLDLMMPGMDGYEVLRRLRLNHPAAELPVLVLTAKNLVADVVEGFAQGANDYLLKPFSRKELAARLKSHLEVSRRYKSYSRLAPRGILALLEGASAPLEARGVSRREREVLELVLCGYGIPEVAQRLFVSRRTVEKHVEHLYDKLGVGNRDELRALVESWTSVES